MEPPELFLFHSVDLVAFMLANGSPVSPRRISRHAPRREK
jgi:hypothetical protein